MNPQENIEKLVSETVLPANEGSDERIVKAAMSAYEKSRTKNSAKERPIVGRIIMKSSLMKIVTAAAVLLIAASVVTIVEVGTKPAWAIEQTVEAMKKARVVHMFCRDWEGEELELWVKLNPETRMADYIYVDYPRHGAQLLSTPYVSYTYIKENNLFQFSNNQQMVIDVRLENIFEDLAAELMQEPGKYNLEVEPGSHPLTGEEEITVSLKGEVSLKVGINPETKLPTRIHMIETNNYGALIKDFDEIYFDEKPPAGIFEFRIPAGAVVVNQDESNKLEEDSDAGLVLDGMSEQEAAERIATEYFELLAQRDFEGLVKIYPATKLKQSKEVYNNLLGQSWPVELLGMDELKWEYGCTIGPALPCTVRHENGVLKEYKLIMKFRDIEGVTSVVVAGWVGMPREIE